MELVVMALAWYFVFLFSLTFHEASHAWAAHRLGDDTAYEGGQVSLNPKVHMQREPFGTIIIPLVTFALSGWMMGWASCPYDPRWAMNYPKRSALMSLAGPVANFIIVIVSGVLIRVGIATGLFMPPLQITFTEVVLGASPGLASSMALLLSIFFSLNLLLAVFNLLPLPPLDGSGILPYFMSEDGARNYMHFISNPTFALIGILIAWNVFDHIFSPVHLLFIRLLYPEFGYG